MTRAGHRCRESHASRREQPRGRTREHCWACVPRPHAEGALGCCLASAGQAAVIFESKVILRGESRG